MAEVGKFEIYKDKAGEFRFRLKAGNGQVILAGECYKAKASCENGIEYVRKNNRNDARFERKESKSGKPMFNLKASNGQVIGTSEMYESNSACENGIASVAKNAPYAQIEDFAYSELRPSANSFEVADEISNRYKNLVERLANR